MTDEFEIHCSIIEKAKAMTRLLMLSVTMIGISISLQKPVDKVYSGPQVGEKMSAFKMRGVFSDDAGKELDPVTKSAGKPMVVLFVHEANRPSMGFTRVLMNYVGQRSTDGLHGAIVWLAADASEADAIIKRMSQALPKGVPIGISVDGKEGPGSYGLNRNVTLTVLVAKENKVTANFALVQPSIPSDLPKVLDEIVKVAGGKAPKLEDLPGVKDMMQKQTPDRDDKLSHMLRQLIRKTATVDEVNKSASEIEAHIKDKDALQREVGRVARALVDGGKLAEYGTPRAREFLKDWAKKYAPKPADPEKKK